MNEAEVRAMLARAEAATPGPWHIAAEHEEQSWWGHAATGTIILGPDPDGFAIGATNDDRMATEADVANAAFLAAARQDVPALAREVLALRAERQELRANLQWALDYLQIEGINQNLLAYLYARKLLEEKL